MAMRRLFTSSAGIEHFWEDDEGTKRVHSFQDTTAMLDRNKAMATHNDGYTPSRDVRRVGSLPIIVVLKWYQDEGWWAYDTHDPDVLKKLKQKLNSSDWAHLRTAPGVL